MFVSLLVIFFFFISIICFVACSVAGCDYVRLRRSREVMCFHTEVVQCLNFFFFFVFLFFVLTFFLYCLFFLYG